MRQGAVTSRGGERERIPSSEANVSPAQHAKCAREVRIRARERGEDVLGEGHQEKYDWGEWGEMRRKAEEMEGGKRGRRRTACKEEGEKRTAQAVAATTDVKELHSTLR